MAYVPRVIITDELKSYGAAKREIMTGVENRQHKRLNNRAELSHHLPDKRNGRCENLNPQGRRNGFCRFTPMLVTCFEFAIVKRPPVIIELQVFYLL